MSTAFHWPILLQRVNGNQALARRLLTTFFIDHGDFSATLAHSDPAQGRLLLHRMGGTAANLALPQLAEACGQGEALAAAACDRQATPWRDCLETLQQRFLTARAEVEDLLSTLAETQPTNPATTPADAPIDAQDQAVRLAGLLAASDLAALTVGEEWARTMPPGDGVTAVLSAIRALDFATAATLLHTETACHD